MPPNKITISLELRDNRFTVLHTTDKDVYFLNDLICSGADFRQAVAAMADEISKLAESEPVKLVILAYPAKP